MCDAPVTLTCTPDLERDFSLADVKGFIVYLLNKITNSEL